MGMVDVLRRRGWYPSNAGTTTATTAWGDPVADAGARALYAAGANQLNGRGLAGGRTIFKRARIPGYLAATATAARVPGGGGRLIGPSGRALPATQGPVDTIDGAAMRMRDLIRSTSGIGGLGS